jgi:aminoacrylate hydrolase
MSSGLGGSAAFWTPQIEALKTRYRIILYDHRGTGRSARDLTEPHSVDAMAADIRMVLDAAGAKSAHIVGHAAGALAAFALALKAPARVAGIVAVNAWSRLDPHTARCFEARVRLLKDSGRRAYVRAQPIFLYPAEWISQNTLSLDAEEAHHLNSFPSIAVVLKRISALTAFDIDAKLPKIKAPVLVSASADDMLVPASCSRRLAERLPNATLDMMAWGGHAMSVTDPERFNSTLLNFLGRTAGG